MFGISLVDSIQYARSSISYIDDLSGIQCFGCIPTIIAKCGSFLKEEGLQQHFPRGQYCIFKLFLG